MAAAHSKNSRVVLICGCVTLGMLGMSYAAVPLYQIFCQVTGYGGTTQRAVAESENVLDRRITIRFDANVSNELDWDFAPKSRSVTVKLGETGQAVYVAKNIAQDASFGTATFNVTPQAAGVYFNKLECFCFTEQELKAGESMDMPVVFFVDPDIVNDPLLKDIGTITLSYTFFADEQAESKVTQLAPAANAGEKL